MNSRYLKQVETLLRVTSSHDRSTSDVSTLAEALRRIKFFSKLPQTVTGRLAAELSLVTYSPGQVLFRAGDTADSWYLILQGSVIVYKEPEAELSFGTIFARLGEGESFGEWALTSDDQKRSATIIPDQLTTIALLSKDVYRNVLKDARAVSLKREGAYWILSTVDCLNRTAGQVEIIGHYLKSLPGMERLSPLDLMDICRYSKGITFDTGARLYEDYEGPLGLFVIVSGKVNVLRRNDMKSEMQGGRNPTETSVLDSRGIDTFVGEEALWRPEAARNLGLFSAVAEDMTEVVMIPKSLYIRILLPHRFSIARSDTASLILRKISTRSLRPHEIEILRESIATDSILQSLDSVTMRAVCLSMAWVAVPGGTTLFHQGDVGDAFYLVLKGEVNVQVDGLHRTVMEAGSCFGEWALLRKAPRSATVTTIVDCEFIKVDGESFISTVEKFRRHRPFIDNSVMNAIYVLKMVDRNERKLKHLESLTPIFSSDPLFLELTRPTKIEMAKYLSYLKMNQGDTLFKAGEHSDFLYILLTGTLSVVGENGESITELFPGFVVGEWGVSKSAPRSATVICQTYCSLARLDKLSYLTILLPGKREKINYDSSLAVLRITKPGYRTMVDVSRISFLLKSVKQFEAFSEKDLLYLSQFARHETIGPSLKPLIVKGDANSLIAIIMSNEVRVTHDWKIGETLSKMRNSNTPRDKSTLSVYKPPLTAPEGTSTRLLKEGPPLEGNSGESSGSAARAVTADRLLLSPRVRLNLACRVDQPLKSGNTGTYILRMLDAFPLGLYMKILPDEWQNKFSTSFNFSSSMSMLSGGPNSGGGPNIPFVKHSMRIYPPRGGSDFILRNDLSFHERGIIGDFEIQPTDEFISYSVIPPLTDDDPENVPVADLLILDRSVFGPVLRERALQPKRERIDILLGNLPTRFRDVLKTVDDRLIEGLHINDRTISIGCSILSALQSSDAIALLSSGRCEVRSCNGGGGGRGLQIIQPSQLLISLQSTPPWGIYDMIATTAEAVVVEFKMKELERIFDPIVIEGLNHVCHNLHNSRLHHCDSATEVGERLELESQKEIAKKSKLATLFGKVVAVQQPLCIDPQSIKITPTERQLRKLMRKQTVIRSVDRNLTS